MPSPSPFSGFLPSDFCSDDVSSSAIIIEPIREDGIDAFFFFLPGALTPAQDYLPLLKEVQAQCACRLRLWVAILDPAGAIFPCTAMIEASFDGVLERVKNLGFPVGVPPSTNVIFGGHSMGSWESRSPARKRADAFIQLGGSFHTSPDNLVQYARPVLTLSGSRDGQITNAAIAKHAGEIVAQKDELGDYFVHVVKPVILIPGMNHAQFSHGIPNTARGDLVAEISNEQARQVASHLISSFMMAHICKEASAIAALREAVAQTQKQYKVFWEAIEDPGRDAKKMQLKLAGIPGLTESRVGSVHHDFSDNFVYSKPWIDSQNSELERIIMHAYFNPEGAFDVLSDMWVKFKAGPAGERKKGDEILRQGASINEKTFKQALALVPEGVRRKYEEGGKKLRFVDDKVVQLEQEWIESIKVSMISTADQEFADVKSTAIFMSSCSSGPAGAGGAAAASSYYVNLLTAARAFSWIYMDAFKA